MTILTSAIKMFARILVLVSCDIRLMWIFVRVLGQKDVSVHSKVVESDEFYVISCLVFQTFKIRPKSS